MKKLIFLLVVISVQQLSCKWEQCNNGINGAQINRLATNGSEIIASTDFGGVYLSPINEINWNLLDSNFIDYWGGYVGFKGDTLLVSVNKYQANNNGLYFYTNNNGKWETIGYTLNHKVIRNFIFHEGIAYAATDTGIYISHDNCGSWRYLQSKINFTSYVDFLTIGKRLICSVLNDGEIFEFFDSGNIIKVLNSQNLLPSIYKLKEVNGKLLAGTSKGLFISQDTGRTWNLADTSLPSENVFSISSNLNDTYITFVYNGVYLSTDSLKSWHKVNNSLISSIVELLSHNNYIIAASSRFGIYTSNDKGQNWQEKNEGLKDFLVGSFTQENKDIVISTAYSGIYLSQDNGLTWKNIIGSLKSNKNIKITKLLLLNNVLYAGTDGNGVYKTTNYSTEWVRVDQLSQLRVNDIIHSNNHIFIGGFSQNIDTKIGLFISSDNGINWYDGGNGLSYPSVYFITNLDSSVYLISNNTLYVYSFQNINCVEICKSTDLFFDFSFLEYAFNRFYLGSKGLKISENEGKDWIDFPNNLSNLEIKNIKVYNNILFALTDYCVYLSSDSGKKWVSINDGLPSGLYYNFYLRDNWIFVSTGIGLYRANISDFGITRITESSISSKIFDISPNPATDFIEISVGASGRSPLQSDVRIFSVFGQIVNLAPTLTASREGARIDVSGLAPGMYFIRIGERISKFVKL